LGKSLFSYVLIAPCIAIMLFVVAYPTVYALYVSFFSWNLAQPRLGFKFVGLDNYAKALLDDPLFIESVKTTFYFVILSVTTEFFLGFGLSLLLHRELRGVSVIRSILLLPMMIAPILVALMWRYMYFGEYGILPYIITWILGIQLPAGGLIGDKVLALISIVIADAWEWTPLVMLILLAGLESLPIDPFESAVVDGASTYQTFKYITLPLMRPFILVALLMRTMDAFKIFDLVYVLTKGGPGTATMVMGFYAYNEGLKFFNIGYAASLVMIISYIVIFVSLTYIRVIYRGKEI